MYRHVNVLLGLLVNVKQGGAVGDCTIQMVTHITMAQEPWIDQLLSYASPVLGDAVSITTTPLLEYAVKNGLLHLYIRFDVSRKSFISAVQIFQRAPVRTS
jgi:hypothetical protein